MLKKKTIFGRGEAQVNNIHNNLLQNCCQGRMKLCTAACVINYQLDAFKASKQAFILPLVDGELFTFASMF